MFVTSKCVSEHRFIAMKGQWFDGVSLGGWFVCMPSQMVVRDQTFFILWISSMNSGVVRSSSHLAISMMYFYWKKIEELIA